MFRAISHMILEISYTISDMFTTFPFHEAAAAAVVVMIVSASSQVSQSTSLKSRRGGEEEWIYYLTGY